MLLVTELASEVQQQLPSSSDSIGGSGVVVGNVLEISLATEAAGTVALSNVSGLATPVLFQMRSSVLAGSR